MAGMVPWSELPTELWSIIGKNLNTRMDVNRFRGVCSPWRSSIPPASEFELRIGTAFIGRCTVYLLEPSPPPTSPEDSQIPPSREGWLIKVTDDEGQSGRGKVQLFNPLSSQPIFPQGEDGARYPRALRKVIMLPDSPWAVREETTVVGIFGEGKLKCWKHGDEDWDHVDDPTCRYDDLISYKGQFYVVDRFGTVSWINPSFQIVPFSPPVCGGRGGDGGDRKHLVESGGDLYVVDRYFVERSRFSRIRASAMREVAGFRVHRLNQEWGKWDEIRNLGDVALFLGDHSCFSVSMRGFSGCEGNCIYFTETSAATRGGKVRVFDVGDRSIKRASCSPDHLRILWPPPAWVAPDGAALTPGSREEPVF